MKEIIENLKENNVIVVKGEKYKIKTKTWYSIMEDESVSYIKCELSEGKVLVVIPSDNIIYIGEVIDNMNYQKTDDETIEYKNEIFKKVGEGHQYIKNIEFGEEELVEGKCSFTDYDGDDHVISLGYLEDKKKEADVYALKLETSDIEFI